MKCFVVMLALQLLPFFGGQASAQTITRTLDWTQPGTAAATANSYTYSWSVDNGAATQLTQTCVTSTTNSADSTCSAPITLTPGAHTIVLTASDASGSTPSLPFAYNPGTIPTAPSSISIVIRITVP